MYAYLDQDPRGRDHSADQPAAGPGTANRSGLTLDAIARAVMSTELLPGEDPALLPGPDRIEIHHVIGYHLPRIHHPARRCRGPG